MASQFLIVAEEVMRRTRRPLGPRELVSLGRKFGLFSDKLAGETPHQTMKAKLSVDIRTHGERSIFVRTSPGKFYLRDMLSSAQDVYIAQPLRPPPPQEQVLVFPSQQLDRLGRFQGTTSRWEAVLPELLSPSAVKYMPRLLAEKSGYYKQLLTYILVVKDQRVLMFKRGTYNRAEESLRGSLCIGFGGHVTSDDRNLFEANGVGILRSAARELAEELSLPVEDLRRLDSFQGLKISGLLNDDSSPLGQRHFAVILSYDASSSPKWSDPKRGEKSITQLRWLNPDAATVSMWSFEYWSQLCLRTYFPQLVNSQPSHLLRRRLPLRPPHILCVTGEIGSGKTEATEILTSEFGYVEVNSGRMVAELIGLPRVPITDRSTFQRAARAFITSPGGPEQLARALLRRASDTGSERILIDGIRQVSTLRHLRELAKPRRVGVLFVQTPPDVAFDFYNQRLGHHESMMDFFARRNDPVESEVRDMIGEADAVLYNWTGQQNYRQTIHNLMQDLEATSRAKAKAT